MPSFRFVLPLALGVALLAAWVLPEPKPHAVLGRFGYLQFLAVLVVGASFLLALGVACFPASGRREVGLRVATVCFSIALVLVPFEVFSYLRRPIANEDNPWYLATGKGRLADDLLPYVRPPKLHWRGSSRGDLAILSGDEDPYARTVTFETDFQGFRNSRDLERADLVFIGDSFTEAGNVPEAETFVRLTAERLGRTGRNLGLAGLTPPTELVVLKRFGLPAKPAVVVWQLYEGNDLREAVRYRKWLADGRPPFTPRAPPSRRESWQHRSPSFRLYAWLRAPKPWRGPSGTFRDAGGRTHTVRMLRFPDPSLKPEAHPGFSDLVEALREGSRLLHAADVDLLVLHIPTKFRAMAPAMAFDDATLRELHALGLERPAWDLPASHLLAASLERLCAELGVPFLDALAHLRSRASEGELVYAPLDTHLSPAGHRVVTELIVETLDARAGEPGGPDDPETARTSS